MVGQTSVTFVAGDARLALTYASPVALAALRSYALQDTAYRDVATYLRDIVYTTLCLKKKTRHLIFTATCFSNVAVMGSLGVRPSVCNVGGL